VTWGRLAYPLGVLAMALAVAGSVVSTAVDWAGWGDLPFGLAFGMVGIASGLTGAVVASRQPANPVGWLVLAMGVGVGLLMAAGAYAELGVLTSLGPLPGQAPAAWFADVLSIPIFFGITGLLLLLFPTGRPLSRGWRWYTWAFGAVVGLASLSYGWSPARSGRGSRTRSPWRATEPASLASWPT